MRTESTWAPPAGESSRRASEQVKADILGIPDGRLATVSRAIQAGFSYDTFRRLAKALGLDNRSLACLLGKSAGVLARRRKKGHFTTAESDRMWMLLRLYLRALEVHGDEVAARQWLMAPLPALGKRSALEVSKDSAGTERALAVLRQIHYGVFG